MQCRLIHGGVPWNGKGQTRLFLSNFRSVMATEGQRERGAKPLSSITLLVLAEWFDVRYSDWFQFVIQYTQH